MYTPPTHLPHSSSPPSPEHTDPPPHPLPVLSGIHSFVAAALPLTHHTPSLSLSLFPPSFPTSFYPPQATGGGGPIHMYRRTSAPREHEPSSTQRFATASAAAGPTTAALHTNPSSTAAAATAGAATATSAPGRLPRRGGGGGGSGVHKKQQAAQQQARRASAASAAAASRAAASPPLCGWVTVGGVQPVTPPHPSYAGVPGSLSSAMAAPSPLPTAAAEVFAGGGDDDAAVGRADRDPYPELEMRLEHHLSSIDLVAEEFMAAVVEEGSRAVWAEATGEADRLRLQQLQASVDEKDEKTELIIQLQEQQLVRLGDEIAEHAVGEGALSEELTRLQQEAAEKQAEVSYVVARHNGAQEEIVQLKESVLSLEALAATQASQLEACGCEIAEHVRTHASLRSDVERLVELLRSDNQALSDLASTQSRQLEACGKEIARQKAELRRLSVSPERSPPPLNHRRQGAAAEAPRTRSPPPPSAAAVAPGIVGEPSPEQASSALSELCRHIDLCGTEIHTHIKEKAALKQRVTELQAEVRRGLQERDSAVAAAAVATPGGAGSAGAQAQHAQGAARSGGSTVRKALDMESLDDVLERCGSRARDAFSPTPGRPVGGGAGGAGADILSPDASETIRLLKQINEVSMQQVEDSVREMNGLRTELSDAESCAATLQDEKEQLLAIIDELAQRTSEAEARALLGPQGGKGEEEECGDEEDGYEDEEEDASTATPSCGAGGGAGGGYEDEEDLQLVEVVEIESVAAEAAAAAAAANSDPLLVGTPIRLDLHEYSERQKGQAAAEAATVVQLQRRVAELEGELTRRDETEEAAAAARAAAAAAASAADTTLDSCETGGDPMTLSDVLLAEAAHDTSELRATVAQLLAEAASADGARRAAAADAAAALADARRATQAAEAERDAAAASAAEAEAAVAAAARQEARAGGTDEEVTMLSEKLLASSRDSAAAAAAAAEAHARSAEDMRQSFEAASGRLQRRVAELEEEVRVLNSFFAAPSAALSVAAARKRIAELEAELEAVASDPDGSNSLAARRALEDEVHTLAARLSAAHAEAAHKIASLEDTVAGLRRGAAANTASARVGVYKAENVRLRREVQSVKEVNKQLMNKVEAAARANSSSPPAAAAKVGDEARSRLLRQAASLYPFYRRQDPPPPVEEVMKKLRAVHASYVSLSNDGTLSVSPGSGSASQLRDSRSSVTPPLPRRLSLPPRHTSPRRSTPRGSSGSGGGGGVDAKTIAVPVSSSEAAPDASAKKSPPKEQLTSTLKNSPPMSL